MSTKLNFNVGDIIIRSGKAHKIFSIEDRVRNNEPEEIIKYKALFIAKNTPDLTFTTPTKSLKTLYIRRPMTKEQLADILKLLSEKLADPIEIDIKKVGEKLNLNDPSQTVEVIRGLLYEKHNTPDSFNMKKKQIIDSAVKCLVQEVAYINDITVEKAQELLTKSLAK